MRPSAAGSSSRLETGRGTKFTISLPLTLAVTQAVMVRAGGATFAIPAVMVEQVRQVKADELAEHSRPRARRSGRTAGTRTATCRGCSADRATLQPEKRQVTPVMLLRTGPNWLRSNVDEIIGNQEIVVKNIGPQLARVAGITGATVLGNGEIVLIINPVHLLPPASRSSRSVPWRARQTRPRRRHPPRRRCRR